MSTLGWSCTIPIDKLGAKALRGVIEEFISRYGTDYGAIEASFEKNFRQVKYKLENGLAVLVFDDKTETTNILPVNDPILKKLDTVTEWSSEMFSQYPPDRIHFKIHPLSLISWSREVLSMDKFSEVTTQCFLFSPSNNSSIISEGVMEVLNLYSPAWKERGDLFIMAKLSNKNLFFTNPARFSISATSRKLESLNILMCTN